MTDYRINLAHIGSWEDFVAAFNAGMIDSIGGHWHGNSLDAFNDYLAFNDVEPYRLILLGWNHCERVLAQIRWPGLASLPQTIQDILSANPHASVVYE